MKNLTYLLLLISSFALTGCIETLEEIFLNKDGSGEYSLTFDMSEMLSNPMMKSMIEEAAKEGGADAVGLDFGETDTLMTMGDGSGGIMDKVVMHLLMSDSAGKFMMNMTLPFDNVEEIAEFQETLAAEGGEQAGSNPMGGMGSGFMMPGGLLKLKKRTLTRMPAPETENDMFSGEDGEFMKMFFAGAAYKTVYHLPGQVKSSTIEGAKIDGKTLTIETSLLDIIDNKAKLDGEIVFKKK